MQLTLPQSALADSSALFPFPAPAALTLRRAGTMKDGAARSRVFQSLGIADRPLARVQQIHSRDVLLAPYGDAVDWRGERLLGEADGIVSGPDGPWLVVSVADCLPVFCLDTQTGAYALLHSGWRGTGIVERAVKLMMERFGTRSGDLSVLIGPGIHAGAYEVDAERAAEFAAWGEEAVVTRNGRHFLDLYAANRGIAKRLGIGMFTEATHCTGTEAAFGSYRREGKDRYTSMAAILGPGSRFPGVGGSSEES